MHAPQTPLKPESDTSCIAASRTSPAKHLSRPIATSPAFRGFYSTANARSWRSMHASHGLATAAANFRATRFRLCGRCFTRRSIKDRMSNLCHFHEEPVSPTKNLGYFILVLALHRLSAPEYPFSICVSWSHFEGPSLRSSVHRSGVLACITAATSEEPTSTAQQRDWRQYCRPICRLKCRPPAQPQTLPQTLPQVLPQVLPRQAALPTIERTVS